MAIFPQKLRWVNKKGHYNLLCSTFLYELQFGAQNQCVYYKTGHQKCLKFFSKHFLGA